MAELRIWSGAAHWAALLFVAALLALSVAAADAKVRVDKLWLVPASGQEVAIDIEVAEDPQEKAMGLMFRTELADNRGMLFPYSEARELSMWMRNTYIPLDMLFIRPDGVIHRIEARAEPMSERIINSRGDGVGRAGAPRRRRRALRRQGRRQGALSAVRRRQALIHTLPLRRLIRRVYSAVGFA